jgi:hypothetical protein
MFIVARTAPGGNRNWAGAVRLRTFERIVNGIQENATLVDTWAEKTPFN